jgi:uncharacterized C2H2 Zn-finger protein
MVPRIHAKFRKRNGVPYAIEQLSGRQFRCRHCNEVFLSEKELDYHIRHVLKNDTHAKGKVCKKAPALSTSVDVRTLYAYDIMDKMKKKWLKLKRGDEYDGI